MIQGKRGGDSILLKKWDEMNCKLSKKIAKCIKRDSYDILAYGINVFINCAEKIFLLFLPHCILGYCKEFWVTIVVLMFIRSYMGGTHQNTNLGCLIQSEIVIGSVIILSKIITMHYAMSLLIMVLTVFVILLLCPVINHRRGKYSSKKIQEIKKKGIICVILVNLFAVCFPQYATLVCLIELAQIMDVSIEKILLKRQRRM